MDWDKYPMTKAIRDFVNTAAAVATEIDGQRRVKFEDLHPTVQSAIVEVFDNTLPTIANITRSAV